MAARNVKSVPGFDAQDKMQSSTLKRQPSPDWSKNDLLRLLSYFEGELQARDITIAALKAEKAKQLLYQAKYGRFGLGDPFLALQRDTIGTRDSNFDEAAVKSMYDNQLAQLENLIATQRKAQLKMREQLASAEKRYHKVCCELEDEKRKHAQDTAQGDDVTYMLEKERERLRQEIDFEKSNSKKLEKDLRRTLAALEEERASAARHKQVALLLLKERKHILHKLAAQAQGANPSELKPDDESEAQHSLSMESALEEQLSSFETERVAMRANLDQEQNRTRELESQVEALQRQVQSMAARTTVDSIEIKSSVSPHVSNSPSSTHTPYSPQRVGALSPSINTNPGSGPGIYPSWASPGPSVTPSFSTSPGKVAVMGGGSTATVLRQVPRAHKDTEGGRVASLSPEREAVQRSGLESSVRKSDAGAVGGYSIGQDRQSASVLSSSPRAEARVVTVGSSGPKSGPLLVGGGSGGVGSSNSAHVSIAPGNSATVMTQGGGKISFHVSPGSAPTNVGVSSVGAGSPRRTITTASSPIPTPSSSAIRAGPPPPVPPNKPNIVPGSSPKPTPPPKVGVMARGSADGKVVQIPVNVVPSSATSPSSSPSPSSSNQSSRETSPIRKAAQWSHPLSATDPPFQPSMSLATPSMTLATHDPDPDPGLEFLGPEMDNLQLMLASLTTGEAGARDSPGLTSSSDSQSLSPPAPTPLSSSPHSSLSQPPHTSYSTPTYSQAAALISPPSVGPSSQPSMSFSSSPTAISHSSSSSPNPFSHSSSSPSTPRLLTTTTTTSAVNGQNAAAHIQNSTVHRLCACGDLATLRTVIMDHEADVNLPMKDGTTPIHSAVDNNQHACLQLLLDNGGNVNALRDDRVTPVHIAAAHGHVQCLHTLLQHGAGVNGFSAGGDTALHLAVDAGHTECCQLLLAHGAHLLQPNSRGLSALHHAILSDRADLLSCLLEGLNCGTDHKQCSSALTAVTQGTTLLHLAAQLPSETCLRLLLKHVQTSWNSELDAHGNSVFTVASPACRHLLTQIMPNGDGSQKTVSLVVELKTQLEGSTVSCTRIGHLDLCPLTPWEQLENDLRSVLRGFLSELDTGLRTRRVLRAERESGSEDGANYALGLTLDNIAMFEMGYYRWSPGMQTERLPYNIASNNEDKKLTIVVDGADNLCELIAFDILHPVSSIREYLRLVLQHRNIVFHGPVNSGKSYLAQRLAQCLAVDLKGQGQKPVVVQLKLTSQTTHQDLVSFLTAKGCLLKTEAKPTGLSPILILDNLEKTDLTVLFGPFLPFLSQRGKHHAFCLVSENSGQTYFLPDKLFILATMNRPRLTGLDREVTETFHWVSLKHDTEPLRNLLPRHFLRRLYHLGNGMLPGNDSALLRATEWVICVWQRLNDSLGKLGLPDVAIGPCGFFKCPLEKQNPHLILQFVKDIWNSVISPQVRDAVKRSTGSQAAPSSQHKVANTALYVLMQRTVVLSCPLPAHEKEAYLKGFNGSNELDLPYKFDKGEQGGSPRSSFSNSSHGSPGSRSSSSSRSSNLQGQISGSPQGSGSSDVQSRLQKPLTPSDALSSQTAAAAASKQRKERGRPFELFSGTNIKRRSLSESSVNKAAQAMDQMEAEGAGLTSPPSQQHAKMPKLEVRSSRILSLGNSFKTTALSPRDANSPRDAKQNTASPLALSGRLSSHHHHHHHHSKKARSSENISPSGLGSGSGQNPFSFSLSTPKSTLTSFKFISPTASSHRSSSTSSSPSSFSSSFSSSSPGREMPVFISEESGAFQENEQNSSPVWNKQSSSATGANSINSVSSSGGSGSTHASQNGNPAKPQSTIQQTSTSNSPPSTQHAAHRNQNNQSLTLKGQPATPKGQLVTPKGHVVTPVRP